jgi:hypothetical protein
VAQAAAVPATTGTSSRHALRARRCPPAGEGDEVRPRARPEPVALGLGVAWLTVARATGAAAQLLQAPCSRASCSNLTLRPRRWRPRSSTRLHRRHAPDAALHFADTLRAAWRSDPIRNGDRLASWGRSARRRHSGRQLSSLGSFCALSVAMIRTGQLGCGTARQLWWKRS